jgi:hypothetical protein
LQQCCELGKSTFWTPRCKDLRCKADCCWLWVVKRIPRGGSSLLCSWLCLSLSCPIWSSLSPHTVLIWNPV